jgi:isopenicillin-N N-acyltransferase-like protein
MIRIEHRRIGILCRRRLGETDGASAWRDLEMTTTFVDIQASCAPYDRGVYIGSQLRSAIRDNLRIYEDTFQHLGWSKWESVRREAAQFADPVAAFDRDIFAELEGTAAGAEVELDDILVLNARSELLFGRLQAALPECTSFAVQTDRRGPTGILIGQNWDWRPEIATAIIRSTGGDGPDFVTLTEAGQAAKIGVNSSGIGLAVNTLINDHDDGRPAVPLHILYRSILDARSLAEAVTTAETHPRSVSGNFVVGSPDGAVDIEAGPSGSVKHVDLGRMRSLTHANTFACPADIGSDRGLEVFPESPGRAARLATLIEDADGDGAVETYLGVLRDHVGFPRAICRHADMTQHPSERIVSKASIVLDLERRAMTVVLGQPCRAQQDRESRHDVQFATADATRGGGSANKLETP